MAAIVRQAVFLAVLLLLASGAAAGSWSKVAESNGGDFTQLFEKSTTTTASHVAGASSQAGFNKGRFNGTSADREDNSGTLGIGGLNGTQAGQPQSTPLNNESLLGYWRLDAATDPLPSENFNVTDYSGKGNNGSSYGSVTRGARGIFGTDSFDFDGTDDQVDIPDPSTDVTNFTVSVWVKFKAGAGGEHTPLVEKNGAGSQDNYPAPFDVRTGNGAFPKDLNMKYGQGGTANTLSKSNAFQQGEWYHVAVAADNTDGGRAYIDGVQVDSNANTDLKDEEQKIILAQRLDQLGHAAVNLDEVRIYNRSLSNESIQQLYHRGRDGDGLFEGNYTREGVSVPSGESLSTLQVHSDNVSSTVGNSTWFNVTHSSGEQQVVRVDTGDDVFRNYSLSFSNTGGTADLDINMTADTPLLTPQIRLFDLFSSGTTGPSGWSVFN